MRDLGESDDFYAWYDPEIETFYLQIMPMRICLDFDPIHFKELLEFMKIMEKKYNDYKWEKESEDLK